MAYKITFTETREAVLEWSDLEKHWDTYKKAEISDQIIIKPEGRNIHSRVFRPNVVYHIYDYLIPPKNRRKMILVFLCRPTGYPFDVVIEKELKIKSPRIPQELFDAIIVADKEYSRVGGGVSYLFPLHKSVDASTTLLRAIEDVLKQ